MINCVCVLYNQNYYNAYLEKYTNTRNDSMVIYLPRNFQGLLQNDSLQLPHIKYLFLEITQPRNFTSLVIPRLSNASFDEFLFSIQDIIYTTSRTKLPFYIIEDLNINLLRNNNNVHKPFLFPFFPPITKPTRVAILSVFVIDHIRTNNFLIYQLIYRTLPSVIT